MNLRRQVVRRTAHWPLLGRLYRVYYALALTCLRYWLQHQPEALGLYVRGSYARGDWIAGRSDLDLSLVLRGGLHCRQTLRFVQRWQSFQPFYLGCFPMAHDSELLREEWLPLLVREDWRTVWGPEKSPAGPAADAASEALNLYLYALRPWIGPLASSQESLRCLVLARGVRKLERLLKISVGSLDETDANDVLGALLWALSHIGEASVGSCWEPAGSLDSAQGNFLLLRPGPNRTGAVRFWSSWKGSSERVVLPLSAFQYYLVHTDPLRGAALLEQDCRLEGIGRHQLPCPDADDLRRGWKQAARHYVRGCLRPLSADWSPCLGLTLVHALGCEELCYEPERLMALYPGVQDLASNWERRTWIEEQIVQLLV